MKIQNGINSSVNFNGIYNNKYTLKALEKIADHGASFAVLTSFVMGAMVRPLVISATPNTDKENKKYAVANSIGSAVMKLGIAEAVAIPVENAIKKIDKNPENFLKSDTIKRLMPKGIDSKPYKFASQFLKLGTNLLTAIPKSLLTIAVIPVLVNKMFKDSKKDEIKPVSFEQKYDPVFDKVLKNKNAPTFKGNLVQKGVSGILNNKKFGEFIVKHDFNSTNIARNMSVATDALLAGSFAIKTKFSKKIDEDRKPALIYNSLISTGISILGGCSVDKLVQKGCEKSVEKFKQANINDPKLSKYIEGINILRPTLIFAGIYYGLLPMFSFYTADKIDKFSKESKK